MLHHVWYAKILSELRCKFTVTVDKPKPNSHQAIGAEEDIELVPYGCAKLRMIEMPIIKTIK